MFVEKRKPTCQDSNRGIFPFFPLVSKEFSYNRIIPNSRIFKSNQFQFWRTIHQFCKLEIEMTKNFLRPIIRINSNPKLLGSTKDNSKMGFLVVLVTILVMPK